MSSKPRRRKRKAESLCRLEPLFMRVRETLIHDLGDVITNRLKGDRARRRESQFHYGAPPYAFKKYAQLAHFDKRIIWSSDRSFDDLSKESFAGFKASQETFGCPEPMSQRALLVVQEARKICEGVLGRIPYKFSYDRWFDSCSFGKRAAVGLTRRESYLDKRFECLSGTDFQWAAFNECLSRDIHLFRAVRKRTRRKLTVDAIKVTAVPKSFKSARIIAPDTILGGFLSRGLGDVVRAQLEKETHIDLAIQQERHRRWAKTASKTGHLSTIDMSKASDSFVWRHIELLVPEDWHEALQCVRTPLVEVEGEVIRPTSYMLMGSGHTFPLQTLLFWCLAEATRTLLNCRGKASVYGDDIIVPTRIADQLIAVLSELGFSINSGKSFFDRPDPERPSHTFFRESCGGDYKGGIDVRPYMPECDLQEDGQVPRNKYVAWCHKILNGLLDHWDIEEIPSSCQYLIQEIASKAPMLCFVPTWEVEHAGIRHHIDQFYTYGLNCGYIKYHRSVPTYYKLTATRPKRKRSREERPYVWYSYWLRRKAMHYDGEARKPFLTSMKDVERGEAGVDLYDTVISLNGESRRDRDDVYRWKRANTHCFAKGESM